MKRGRKKSNTQTKARKTVFSVVQPWIIYFTERYSDSSEKDFFTFIKARSFDSAKNILKEKSKEDDESIKIKAVQGFLLHKNYKNTKISLKLDIEGWEMVHQASFPNINNFLFKKETPRPEGYSNRFNKTNLTHLKTIGFQKGPNNWSTQNRKGKHLPIGERQGKKWTGDKWVEMDKDELASIKFKIIMSLNKNGNNRLHAAKSLGVCRNKFYKLMKTVHPLSWWNKNYPKPKPIPPRVPRSQRSAKQKEVMAIRKAQGGQFFDKSEEAEIKRLAALRKSKEKITREYRKSLIPKIKSALLDNNNHRPKAAKSLNIARSTMTKWLKVTSEYVNWNEEFPANYGKSKIK